MFRSIAGAFVLALGFALAACGGSGLPFEGERASRVHALDPPTPGASGGTFGATRPGASGGTFGSTAPGASGGTFGATRPGASGGSFGAIRPGASGGTFGVVLRTGGLGGGGGSGCDSLCLKVVACTTDVSAAQCVAQCPALPASIVACVNDSEGCGALGRCFSTSGGGDDGGGNNTCGTPAPTCASLCCRLVTQCGSGGSQRDCVSSCNGGVSESQLSCAAEASSCAAINACFQG